MLSFVHTSQVNDNRLTAILLKPITTAKNAFKFRNSLQLIKKKSKEILFVGDY
jgi:hypothetical protein